LAGAGELVEIGKAHRSLVYRTRRVPQARQISGATTQ
jgi:hypothetical protein